MIFTQALKIALLMLIAATKFMYAPTAVYVAGYSYLETIAITSIGGFIGVVVFYQIGHVLVGWFNRRFPPKKEKKKFSKKNRAFINFRQKYGIYGLAFVTPCIISIPFGCIIAAKYYGSNKMMLPLLLIAVVFWSVVLTSLNYLIGPLFG